MDTLSDLGWVKGDFLRLNISSVAKRTMRMAGMDALDLADIPLDDFETFMLREGHTEGVSHAAREREPQGCDECKVENVHDVITAVAYLGLR